MRKDKSIKTTELKINYHIFYEKWYKNLPYILSIPWFVVTGFICIYDVFVKDIIAKYIGGYNGIFVDIVGNGYVDSRLFAVILWIVIFSFGYFIFFVTAICVSYKIKILNELEKINNSLKINNENTDIKNSL